MVVVTIMMLAGRLITLLLLSGLVLAMVVPTYTVSARKCDATFKVNISPASETIPRGSNFQFTISATGPQCLTDLHAIWGASISPNMPNGPAPIPQTSYSLFINIGGGLFRGTTNSSIVTGTYTITTVVTGVQGAIAGEQHIGTASPIIT